MKGERVLVVDIGNRWVKTYITVGDELGGRWSYPTGGVEWSNRLREIAERSACAAAVLVSVVPDAGELALAILQRAQIETTVVSGDMDLPVKVEYASPERLGADRVAVAVGAWHFYGDQADTVVVVDAGTAVTVDLVRQGKYHGGAILPGIDMMTDALHRRAAQLPQVTRRTKPQFPGKGTEQSIAAGVYAAVAGAVDFLWHRYTKRAKRGVLVMTGGDAERISPLVKAPHLVDPLLLVKGAVAILDFTRQKEA